MKKGKYKFHVFTNSNFAFIFHFKSKKIQMLIIRNSSMNFKLLLAASLLFSVKEVNGSIIGLVNDLVPTVNVGIDLGNSGSDQGWGDYTFDTGFGNVGGNGDIPQDPVPSTPTTPSTPIPTPTPTPAPTDNSANYQGKDRCYSR